MEKEISDLFKSELSKSEFDEARFTIEYSESGDAESQGYIMLHGNRSSAPVPREVRRMIKSYFDTVKADQAKRFNKVILSVSKNIDPTIQYLWEDATLKKDKSDSARVFPQWINERIMGFIYDTEFPNGPTEQDDDGDPLYVSTWDRGVFTFKINHGKISSDILLYQGGNERRIDIALPDYFTKALLAHHEITNNGILKDEWKPWNTLVIHSPHNDLPYASMNEHVFYSNE